MRVLMCPPEYFSIDYEINPWMDKEKPVNGVLAQKQWEILKQSYSDLGVEVETVNPVEGLPDMVFTANAGLVQDKKAIVSNFKYIERKPESVYFQNWFKSNGFEVLTLDENELFEGQGEALVIGDNLIVGYGFRASLSSHEKIKRFLNREIVSVKLVDQRFYHLDTCFLPLNSTTALYFPRAFDEESRVKLQAIIPNLIEASEEEAVNFICNSVIVNDFIFMPSVSERLRSQIEGFGLKIKVIEVSEFKKSGGGVRCLTLNLD